MKTIILVVLALALAGCARFEVYKESDLSGKETGFRIYTPKPYVLVKYTGNDDKPYEYSVVYLPDLKSPVYASPKSGLGSSNLTMKFNENGTLSEFGQQVDTQVPELIKSVGEFAKLFTDTQKAAMTMQGGQKAEGSKPPSFFLFEIDTSVSPPEIKAVQRK